MDAFKSVQTFVLMSIFSWIMNPVFYKIQIVKDILMEKSRGIWDLVQKILNRDQNALLKVCREQSLWWIENCTFLQSFLNLYSNIVLCNLRKKIAEKLIKRNNIFKNTNYMYNLYIYMQLSNLKVEGNFQHTWGESWNHREIISLHILRKQWDSKNFIQLINYLW